MIKTIFKLFYNNILSICYDTKKYQQDDIIIDLNKYNNFDYKIQKKTEFNKDIFFEYNLIKKDNNKILDNTINNQENMLSDIENENSYDDCKLKEAISDIDDKYDKLTDFV